MGPAPPRYSTWPLPPYRYAPGRAPHPRRDPAGHSHGRPAPRPPRCDPERWWESAWYRHAVDLYNRAYYWECHEVLEGLWIAAGRETREGDFFRALVQIAAANLQRSIGREGGARRLARRALRRLRPLPSRFFGVEVATFAGAVERDFAGEGPGPVPIHLAEPTEEEAWPTSR